MIPGNVKIMLCTTPCDMRKQARGLSAVVIAELGQDPRSGNVFAFLNRGRDILRLRFWDRSGTCVLSKKLDEGRFKVRRQSDGTTLVLNLSSSEFGDLIAGK